MQAKKSPLRRDARGGKCWLMLLCCSFNQGPLGARDARRLLRRPRGRRAWRMRCWRRGSWMKRDGMRNGAGGVSSGILSGFFKWHGLPARGRRSRRFAWRGHLAREFARNTGWQPVPLSNPRAGSPCHSTHGQDARATSASRRATRRARQRRQDKEGSARRHHRHRRRRNRCRFRRYFRRRRWSGFCRWR